MKNRKIKVVYDKKTGNIIPCIWEKDGTVTITSKKKVNLENIIVSMVDVNLVDFETNMVLLLER